MYCPIAQLIYIHLQTKKQKTRIINSNNKLPERKIDTEKNLSEKLKWEEGFP